MVECDRDQIGKFALAALRAAGCVGTIPTPLDDIAAALKIKSVEPLFDLGEDHVDLPPGLMERVRKLSGKVLGALAISERVIYIDRRKAVGPRRFYLGHELGHDVLPWHEAAYFGDDKHTLRASTKEQLEAEASFFSSDVLFQLARFSEMANEEPLGLATPLKMSEDWETSYHATIRRYVEGHHRACALLVLGRYVASIEGGRALRLMEKLTVESSSFRERYGKISDRFPAFLMVQEETLTADAYSLLTQATDEPILRRDNLVSGSDRFEYELYCNRHFVFALVRPRRRIHLPRRERVEWASTRPA